MDKIKVKPVQGTNFKEVEVTTKNWNMESRKFINRAFRKATLNKDDYSWFDACCDVLDQVTTFTEEEIFNLSKDEIDVIATKLAEEINKKK